MAKLLSNKLNKDVLSIINIYKVSYDNFEYHKKNNKRILKEVENIFKLIKSNEEYENIVNTNFSNYLLDWIENEKQEKYKREFEEHFEIDYGEL